MRHTRHEKRKKVGKNATLPTKEDEGKREGGRKGGREKGREGERGDR